MEFNFRKMSFTQALLFGVLLIALFNPIILQGVGNGTQVNQTVPTFDKITVEQSTETFDTRVQTIKDVYDSNGKLFYRAEFRVVGTDFTFVCNIPEDKAENLSKDALYLCDVTLAYPKEVCDQILSNREANTTVETLVKNMSQLRKVSKLDFMYTNYITTELDTLDDIQSSFEKTYLKDMSEESNESSESSEESSKA